MKAITGILVFAALAASAFALYFHASASKVGDALEEAQSEVRQMQSELAATKIRGDGESADLEGVPEEVLRSRIAELEAKLGEKEAAVMALNQQLAAAPEEATEVEEVVEDQAARDARRQQAREDWQQQRMERMAQLREENPEEYARIQQERQDFQRRVVDHVGGQVEFFAGLNTEGLPQEYVDNHVALVAKLSDFQARINAMNTDPMAEGDGEGRRELFGAMREIAPMLEMERAAMMNDFAMELGYKAEEASSFAEYVDYVNEMTSPRGMFRNMGGGDRGGDRGGRGGPGGGGRGP